MSGLEKDKPSDIIVEEISDHSNHDQAEMIADHYASISNQYEPLRKEDLPGDYSNHGELPSYVAPFKVNKIIKSMNKKSATVLYN